MNETGYDWLVSESARPYLRDVGANLPPTPRRIARLRRDLSPAQTTLVCQQAELRDRARKKFARAAEMFFTPIGLEQSTDERIAAYKASTIEAGQRVADLCCGIGGDLIAFAQAHETVGFDNDDRSVLFANANLALYQPESATACRSGKVGRASEARSADVTSVRLRDFDAWHIDPDRRPGKKRTTQVELHEPKWATIESLLEQNPNGLIKLAPGASPPPSVAERVEAEWIGSRRECKQLLLRHGTFARHPGRRTATIVDGDARTVVAVDQAPIDFQEDVGRFVFESHAALLAAGIVPTVAAASGLKAFALAGRGEGIAWGYLTADEPVHAIGFQRFEVALDVPFDRKKVVAAVRDNDWHVAEVKKRGVQETPQQIQSWIEKAVLRDRTRHGIEDETRAVTLILAPTQRGVRAVFARRQDDLTT